MTNQRFQKVAIMQPYLFPYLGYFQLISEVDCFVFHDDVQWIKGGWLTKNRLLADSGQIIQFSFSTQKSSHSTLINQKIFSAEVYTQKQKLLRQIRQFYRKSPYYKDVYKLIEACILYDEKSIARFNFMAINSICKYLEIDTVLTWSSELAKSEELKKQERVIDICEVVGGGHYINPIGGLPLYDKLAFKQREITLNFLQSHLPEYKQLHTCTFEAGLSIIDVLFCNDKAKIKEMLQQFTLV